MRRAARSRRAYALLLLLASAAASAAPLATELRASPSPVFFTAGEAGVWARSVDGRLALQLAPGPVVQAHLDAERELVWFTTAGTLQVIDLRAADRAPIAIATDVPPRTRLRLLVDPPATPAGSHTELAVQARPPALVARVVKGADWSWWYGGKEGESQLAALQEEASRAKLVGSEWLAKQAGRKPRASSRDGTTPTRRARVTVPTSLARCDASPSACGSSVAFGPYQLVTVEITCGDFCEPSCLFHDATRNLYAVPPSTTAFVRAPRIERSGPCGDFKLDRRARHFLTRDSLCELGGACTELADPPLGWLDPGAVYQLPDVGAPP